MKKTVAFLCSLITLLFLFHTPVLANRYNVVSKDVSQTNITIKCGENVYAIINNDSKVITLTGSGETYDGKIDVKIESSKWTLKVENGITYLGKDLFRGVFFEKIELPDSLLSIGEGSLNYQSALETHKLDVVLPSNLEYVAPGAFGMNLRSIKLPPNIQYGDNVFSSMYSLERVSFDDRATVIYNEMFQRCTELTTIDFPSSLIKIGSYAFSGCRSLKNVDLPDNMTSIWHSVFSGCKNLTAVDLPKNLNLLGRDAFFGCSNLQEVTIYPATTTIYPGAFDMCPKLMIKGYSGSAAEKYAKTYGIPFKSIGTATSPIKKGVSFWDNNVKYRTADSSSVIVTAVARSKEWIQLPDTVKYKGVKLVVSGIGNEALKGNSKILTFKCGEFVSTIGKRAFEGSNLHSIDFKSGLTDIRYAAFRDCKNLSVVNIPQKVKTIETSAFNGCKKLNRVYFGNSKVKEIGTYAFHNVSPKVTFYLGNYKYHYNQLFKGLKYPKGAKFI